MLSHTLRNVINSNTMWLYKENGKNLFFSRLAIGITPYLCSFQVALCETRHEEWLGKQALLCYWQEVSKYTVVFHLTKTNSISSFPHLGLGLIEHERGIFFLFFRVAFMSLYFFAQMRGTSVSLGCTTWTMDWQIGRHRSYFWHAPWLAVWPGINHLHLSLFPKARELLKHSPLYPVSQPVSCYRLDNRTELCHMSEESGSQLLIFFLIWFNRLV